MLEFSHFDLSSDPLSGRYVKSEVVDVAFALEAGALDSPEGPNRYRTGDAIVTGSTGTRWSVSRDRFDAKYEAQAPLLQGDEGRYNAKQLPVLARQILEPFTAVRSSGGDRLSGEPGDWLLQYGPGDFGIAQNERFIRVYVKLPPA